MVEINDEGHELLPRKKPFATSVKESAKSLLMKSGENLRIRAELSPGSQLEY